MSDPDASSPLVYLVGAGPGDPGLLTRRAAECLARADLVLYDVLVTDRILDQLPPGVERICVRDLPGNHPDRYPFIHQTLIESARAGRVVVRLKGGDPLIFGRGGEEAEALRDAGIPYEIVPGVTAALAAGAYLDVPLTHRHHASAIAFVTGHETPGKPTSRLDWAALARFPGTLAIYMGLSRLPAIVAELVRHGKPPETAALLVHDASTGEQRSVVSTLADLEDARRRAGVEAPALILIGEVVAARPEQAWSERRPLHGRRVLVTRPRAQAESMLRRLDLLGATAFLLPAVEVRPPADWSAVDRALDRLRGREFDWLVFTSANGVEHLIARLLARGRDLRDLASVKLAAIGPRTADALRERHLVADLQPEGAYDSEALADALVQAAAGARVLLARADRGRDVLRERLAPVAHVEQVAVYEQVDAVSADDEVYDRLRRGEIEFVTFTSSNVARAVLRNCDEVVRGRVRNGQVRVVTISPVTSRAVREMGFEVSAEAEVYTVDGVITALTRAAADRAREPEEA